MRGAQMLGLATTLLLVVVLSGAGPAASKTSFPFHRNDYRILELPVQRLPYYAAAAGPLDGSGTYDEHGVSVRIIDGRAYDHPVLQAQFMLTRLASYHHNRDPRYLARVEAHAERLLANAVHARGAIYLPYPFDWALHGDRTDMMTAPWYSAMAQGQAMSAFVRLHGVTGKQRYADAAMQLFASFTNLRSGGGPWTVDVDSDGYLWFEEYAKHPGADRALNGHIFAIYGLYDYFRTTGSAQAKELVQGGITAVEGHLDEIRDPGWLSRYCLGHPEYAYPNYHTVHVGQIYKLYEMTGASSLAVSGDRLLEDYPAAQLGGRGYVGAGSHQVHRLDSARRIIESRTVELGAAEAVSIGARHRVAGASGVWLQVTSGTLAGYWVREVYGRAFIKLSVETYTLAPARIVQFRQGTYTGYTFNSLGVRATAKTFTLRAASLAHTDRRTVMNGMLYYLIVDGVCAGRWIPAQDGVEPR